MKKLSQKQIARLKPSSLIKLAIRDLHLVRRDKRNYKVDMSCWHEPHVGQCNVCFAGSVLAKSLRMPASLDFLKNQSAFSQEFHSAMSALNLFRQGVCFGCCSDHG